jgi:hypothetical protein
MGKCGTRTIRRIPIRGNVRTWFVLAIVCITACHCWAEDGSIPRDVANWLTLAPPKHNSLAWRAANSSQYEWLVSEDHGHVVATKAPRHWPTPPKLPFRLVRRVPDGEIRAVRVADGWLVGRDAGEWGGDLWWYSPNGVKRYEISRRQVRGFYDTPGGLFGIDGLAHMSLDFGHVLRLRTNSTGHWIAETFADLHGAPRVAMADADGSLLIVTTRRLLRVHPDKRVEELLADAFWWGMYPISIVKTGSGNIYIGMRHGIVRIRRDDAKNTLAWLLPNEAFVKAKPEFE